MIQFLSISDIYRNRKACMFDIHFHHTYLCPANVASCMINSLFRRSCSIGFDHGDLT